MIQPDFDPDADYQLFRQQMQKVTPLKQVELATPNQPKKRVLGRRRVALHRHEEHQIEHWWQHAQDLHRAIDYRVHAFASLYYAHPNVSSKKLSQLKQGNFATRCIIDLHGMTEVQATEVLTHWLLRCRLGSDKFALIIHGKGSGSNQEEPVLKNFLNWWLRNHTRVQAFCSAREQDGGTGAVYVLLRSIESH